MRPKLSPLAAAVALLAQSAHPDDEMFVVNFSDHVSLDLPGGIPFTHDGGDLQTALFATSAAGRTSLYDAVIAGLDHLRAGQWDKRALIVVSDGGDNASLHTYAQVRAAARESQTVIYAVGLIDESTGEDERPDVLERLCSDSGGVAMFPRTNDEIAAVLAQVGRDLREQYTLGFVPATRTAGAVHKITVTASAPGLGKLHVRTRADYAVPRGPLGSNPEDPR
jgi:Ca-activated chloride channel family protein